MCENFYSIFFVIFIISINILMTTRVTTVMNVLSDGKVESSTDSTYTKVPETEAVTKAIPMSKDNLK